MNTSTTYKPTHTSTTTHTLAAPRAATSVSSSARLAEYVSRGFILLTPEDLGVDASIHPQIHRQTSRALNSHARQRVKRRDAATPGDAQRAPAEQVGRGLPPTPAGVGTAAPTPATEEESVKEKMIFHPNLAAQVPALSEIFASSGFTEAVEGILGPGWAIVPFASSVIPAGSHDQHWHKDDMLPWNARKPGLRHHHLETIDMFYYPQTVTETMAPTALVPHSQYWTFDHDENNDNICIEMLDYNFVRERMGEHPDLAERDRRFDSAVAGTQWPLVRQVKLCVRAGSVVLMNQNCFHRGQRRSDDPSRWAENPRYLWRFWLYRTAEPPLAQASDLSLSKNENENENACMRLLPTVDPLTGIPLHSPEAAPVWESVFAWATGAAPPGVATPQPTGELETRLHLLGDEAEPLRVAAAYHLATTAQGVDVLRRAFVDDRESVRRAATHGIVAAGAETACEVALDVVRSPSTHKWARKNAAWALGEAAPAQPLVVDALGELLKREHSVHVRATCAASLGLVGRRALRDGRPEVAAGVVSALVECLDREENRPCQAIAQNRGIYDIRPTDESDMCEGSAEPPRELSQAVLRPDGKPRFAQVRSAVRENALWAAVTLATQRGSGSRRLSNASIEALRRAMLRVIKTDNNIVCFGFALDALCRLAATQGGEAIIEAQRLVSAEPVVCVASLWQTQRLTGGRVI
jgi:hypothetical protein